MEWLIIIIYYTDLILRFEVIKSYQDDIESKAYIVICIEGQLL